MNVIDIARLSNGQLDQIAERQERVIDADLMEMNKQFAVVKVGGKTRVVSIEDDPTYPSCKVPVFSTINDFCQFHDRRKKIVSNEDGTTRRATVAMNPRSRG